MINGKMIQQANTERVTGWFSADEIADMRNVTDSLGRIIRADTADDGSMTLYAYDPTSGAFLEGLGSGRRRVTGDRTIRRTR